MSFILVRVGSEDAFDNQLRGKTMKPLVSARMCYLGSFSSCRFNATDPAAFRRIDALTVHHAAARHRPSRLARSENHSQLASRALKNPV